MYLILHNGVRFFLVLFPLVLLSFPYFSFLTFCLSLLFVSFIAFFIIVTLWRIALYFRDFRKSLQAVVGIILQIGHDLCFLTRNLKHYNFRTGYGFVKRSYSIMD
jgi:hypothetical protein